MLLHMCCARTKETSKRTAPGTFAHQPSTSSRNGSYWADSKGEAPKGTEDHVTASFGTASITESDSAHGGRVSVVALEDANGLELRRGRSWGPRMETDLKSVASSTPNESAEEMEARVRRKVEAQIRQEIEAPTTTATPLPPIEMASHRLTSQMDRHPRHPPFPHSARPRPNLLHA